VEKSSGEIIEMNVFVAILPASGYTYVQAIRTQSKEDLIAVLNDTLSYYGGVPKAIVPDNLKAAVAKSNKYAPYNQQNPKRLRSSLWMCHRPHQTLCTTG